MEPEGLGLELHQWNSPPHSLFMHGLRGPVTPVTIRATLDVNDDLGISGRLSERLRKSPSELLDEGI